MNIALICTDNEPLSFGLRMVSAVLKTHGYQSRLIFMETGAYTFSEDVLEQLGALIRDYDVVGFSCLAQGSTKAKQVLEYIKPLNKITIWGGVHASLNPGDCAEWADYVCVGEGEGLIVEFMERLDKSEDCKDLLNLAYKENGIFIANNLRPLIGNLDELPLPDFSFDNEYHLAKDKFNQVFTLYNVERNGQIAFTGSRGCAFHCTYCCNIKLKSLYTGRGQYVRRMSIGKFIEQSQQLRKIFPKGRYFYFLDEDFAARPIKELEELAERFPKEVGLPYECLAHPARITEQRLDLLVKSGLFRVRLGIETGSERTKKEVYERHVSNEVVSRATHILSTAPSVAPVYFLIYANPYENRQDLLDTLKLISNLPYGSDLQPFELIFFPGSALYDRAIQDGLIEGGFDSSHEVSYYGGLHHEQYAWKTKNLYLNGLIFLTGGLCTRYRVGTIPRFIFNFLIKPGVVDFNEKHVFFIKVLIKLKALIYRAKYQVAQLLKLIIRDPYAIYNLGYYIKSKLFFKPKPVEPKG